ncbi:MAG: CRTAC1 family protein [Acidobacteriota bacterium]
MHATGSTLLLAVALTTGCRAEGGAGSVLPGTTGGSIEGEWFTERAAETGLDFVHTNGMTGQFYYPEVMPPGAGLIDYDNDGDLDVYLVQGRLLGPGKSGEQKLVPRAAAAPPEGRLYRNDLSVAADGGRTLRFADVTAASGLTAHGYGMGVAVADVNNDGCADLYLTNLGPNRLFRNNCDGTFRDVSAESHTDDSGWSVSAAFFDFDRDGWLDLFVGNYVRYSVDTDIKCFMLAGGPNYCPPQVYRAQPSRLFHNNRDGTFADVTASSGLAVEFGPALGVSTADFSGDGWIDLYVANDGQPNQLWINRHDGTFQSSGLQSGTAIDENGKAKSSMGVDAGDFDNDGDEDLFIAELTGQGSDLFVNDGAGVFEERSAPAGIRFPTLPHTGFGAAWLDFDNDSRLDVGIVNGAVTRDPQRPQEVFSLQQRKQLLRNLGGGRFEDVTDRAGPAFTLPEVGRGAAFGDVDNDGDTDFLIANDNGPVRLLLNNVGNRNHWLGIRLVGSTIARDMLGARVGVVRTDGSILWRRARSDGSYASANDPRVLVGLGRSTAISAFKVLWPSGRVEEFGAVSIDRYTTVTEGSGR